MRSSLNDGKEKVLNAIVKKIIYGTYRWRDEGEKWVLRATKFEMDCAMALEVTLTRVRSCSLS
jgi:hypothetical protein